ncbi:MAG: hypothetical protein WC331_10495 [Candidatus Omnitrophota bacterium]|jgi:hypothetical protein
MEMSPTIKEAISRAGLAAAEKGCDTKCKPLENLECYTYGEKPGEGLMGEISAKVPKSWVLAFVGIFGVVILAGIIVGYHKVETSYSCALEAKQTGAQNSEQIRILDRNDAVMKEQYTYIAQSLKEIKGALKISGGEQ